ncbi:GxxExxY protein [Algisphaera agarilytica]|uniref:GxxExxY protein n=1 Tax=Algisphaera agarilytica TaxID=1385975 RepID=A0A7X0LL01_9BACT|nr:GxxExxY protein [Algisphaera agarilytica]MBB6430141.1 GxxExxY protein [Algisphaera agarilytica]
MGDDIEELIEKVIGAAIEVHRHFGPGSLEATYHRALEIELKLQGIPFESEVPVTLDYKGHPVGQGRIDLLIDGRLVVELKAAHRGADQFKRQVLAYLRATDLPLGLVINFEVGVLKEGLARVRF